MKMAVGIMIIGIIMFGAGLIMFYSIELGESNQVLRFIKNAGTFGGISGMGVFLAGVLLYLVGKNEPGIKEHTDVRDR